MAIRQAGDSLTRCDPNLYGGLYDVSKAKVAPQAASKPTPGKDTIEISGDKLKKDALERLRHPSKFLIIQKNGFMTIGRFLFVAVLFPPYILLYGLPKWILVEALPMLTAIMVPLVEKVQKQTKKGIDVVKQRVFQVFYFVQRLAIPLIQPLVRTWLALQNGMKRLRHQIQVAFNRASEKAGTLLMAPFVALKQNFKKMTHVKLRVSETVAKLKNRMGVTFTSIKELPQNAIAWMSTQFRQLPEYLMRWPRKWKMNFHTSQKSAHIATEWLSQKLQSLKNRFSTFNQPVKKFYRETFKPSLNKILTKWNGFLKKGRDQLDQRKKRVLQFLKQMEEKVRLITIHHVYDKILSMVTFFGFSELWKKVIHQFLYHPLVKVIADAFLKLTSAISVFFLRMTGVAANGLFSAGQYSFVSLGWAVSYPMKASEMGATYAGNVLGVSGKFFRQATYLVLLMVVMTSITLFWGMRSAKRVMSARLGV